MVQLRVYDVVLQHPLPTAFDISGVEHHHKRVSDIKMADFAARRQENIKQNEMFLSELKNPIPKVDPQSKPASKSVKRRATSPRVPTRQSRRIAEASTKPSYNEDRD